MTRFWKYGIQVPNTRNKDRMNEMRRKINAAAVARSSGMKMVETPSGVAMHANPGNTGQQSQQSFVPRWG